VSRTYDNPIRMPYLISGLTTSAVTKHFRGPAGLTGRVVDILASYTTTTVDSGNAALEVGITGTLAQNAKWVVGGGVTAPLADAASEHAGSILPQGTRPNDVPYLLPDTDFIATWVPFSSSGVVDMIVLVDWFL
jgi:hypothetical protein